VAVATASFFLEKSSLSMLAHPTILDSLGRY